MSVRYNPKKNILLSSNLFIIKKHRWGTLDNQSTQLKTFTELQSRKSNQFSQMFTWQIKPEPRVHKSICVKPRTVQQEPAAPLQTQPYLVTKPISIQSLTPRLLEQKSRPFSAFSVPRKSRPQISTRAVSMLSMPQNEKTERPNLLSLLPPNITVGKKSKYNLSLPKRQMDFKTVNVKRAKLIAASHQTKYLLDDMPEQFLIQTSHGCQIGKSSYSINNTNSSVKFKQKKFTGRSFQSPLSQRITKVELALGPSIK